MLHVQEEPVGDAMPTLPVALILETGCEKVQRTGRSLQIFPANRLTLEGVAAVVAGRLSLHALGELGDDLDLPGIRCRGAPLRTCAASAFLRVRLRRRRASIVWHRVGVRAKVHGEDRMGPTLPHIGAPAKPEAIGVAPAGHLQLPLPCEALAN